MALRGRLLVASTTMSDPNFARTVVLVLEHGAEGAVGVVLNRPSRLALEEALPQWRAVAADPAVVFAGGPVQPEVVIGLVRTAGADIPVQQQVLPGVGLADLSGDVPLAAPARLFAGYAGWGSGQLEQEIEAGGWFVVDGQPDDAFASDPDGLWRAVLVRQGGLFTTVTPRPTLN